MAKLSAEAEYILDSIGSDVSRHTLSIESARDTITEKLTDPDPEPVDDVRQFGIVGPDEESLPLRVYRPGGSGPFPVLVFVHGGGWQLGNLDTGDPICRAFVTEAECVVVAVGYRLAPEHPFPAGLTDVYRALEWTDRNIAELNGDPDRIAVGGTSAGGNLATAVSLLTRDRDGPSIGYQLLYAPVVLPPGVDYSLETDLQPRTTEQKSFTSSASAEWHANHYFEREIDRYNQYGSPLLAHDLSGLPPAEIVSAGFDRLRPLCREFAFRLENAGVPVEHTDYEEMTHGFYYLVNDDAVDTPRRAIRNSARLMLATLDG